MAIPTIVELTNKYLQHCEVMRNFSKYTIKGYQNTFRVFFLDTGMTQLNELNKLSVEEFFFNGRVKRHWGGETFRCYMKHLNCFFKWMIRHDYIDTNPITGIEKPRMEQRVPRTLTQEEAQKVIDHSFHGHYRYKFERYRNRAVIGVMLLGGLRKGEVTNLKLNDVSIEGKSIFIKQGKGSKDRVVPINHRLSVILEEYIKDRARLDTSSPHFFISMHAEEPMGYKGIQNLIQKLRARTKINFSAHTLRHAFARLMLEGGCDIYTLSKIMGHAKITTTTIYLSCSGLQMSKSIEMHSLN